MRSLPTTVSILLLALLTPALRAAAPLPARIDYNFHIKPLLSDRCYKCHGPDAASREAGLRLDTEEGARALLGSGHAAITPGNLASSALIARITASDPDDRMPPKKSSLSLAPSEIALLQRWIEEGAPWKNHWSFIPPITPDLPPVQHPEWPINPIDRFILARMEHEGLKPGPMARKETLLRRVTFDLIGLPPTVKEINDFLADDSPQAYEQRVDALLDRKEYGERMAVGWLDLARYSDTYGYQVDRDRFVWPWRNWVIKAFNQNLPYDQFLTWQLAGDLLPNPTDDQILATTFNRLHPQKVEGGSTEEEFRVEYVADRTHTFGTAMLGLTFECMRCHDHKYDPFTQAEYYQVYAYFNNIDESGLYSYFTTSVPTPTLPLLTPAEKEDLQAINRQIDHAARKLDDLKAKTKDRFAAWLRQRPSLPLTPGQIGRFSFEELKDGKLANEADRKTPASTSSANTLVPAREGNGLRLTGDDPVNFSFGNFTRNDPFSAALWINTPDRKERAILFHRSKAWTDAGSRGYQFIIEEGRLSASLIHFWPGNALSVRTTTELPTNTWIHLSMTYDGSSRAAGLNLFINGTPAPVEIIRDNLHKNITGGGGDTITIGERMRDRGFKDGIVDGFEVFNRQLTPIEIAHLHDRTSLQQALTRPEAELTTAQRDQLHDYYLSTTNPDYQSALSTLRKRRIDRSKAADDVTEIMVMRDLPPAQRRSTHRLNRGAYDAPAEEVFPNTPSALPPFPKDQPANRLGLSRWLTDPQHPLTARVAVNHFWLQCFGRGLVRTPEDFGSQGQIPTHPGLLDWLARDFVDHGWNVKRHIKQLVMSATYRQSSGTSPALLASDPENRLWARAPRYRLSAEMIRDNALAVSGLLVDRIGGPSVRPYDVALSFTPVERDKGEGLYRRSLYTYWKQAGPAPTMIALDASRREVCVVQRERTSTPLQALVLLNDPQLVEAARVFAADCLRRHGKDLNTLLGHMFQSLTSRWPTEKETEILTRLHNEQLSHFENAGSAAAEFLKTGDTPAPGDLSPPRLAAATLVACTLMNHTECVRKQ